MPEPVVIELVVDARKAVAGEQQLEASMKNVSAMMERQIALAGGTGASAGRLGAALEKLKASADPVYAAQQRIEKGLGTLDAAFRRGIATEQQIAGLREKLIAQQIGKLDELHAAQLRASLGMATNDNAVKASGSAFAAAGGEAALFSHNLIAGVIAPLAGILSLTAAIGGTKAALQSFGDINDKSGAAGMSPEFFQGIAYEAKLSGVEIGEMAGAMATFNKLSGQAVEGRGKLVTQLKAEHPELLKSLQLATSQEDRFRLVADAIEHAKTQTEQAVIAAAAFGDQGVRIATAFQGGGDEIDQMVAKAKEMGIVVSNDLIAKADDLGDQFDTITGIIDIQMKQALVNLGPVLVSLTGYIASWIKDLNIVLDQFKAVEDRTVLNPLQNQLVELENRMSTIKPMLDGLNTQGITGGMQGVQLQKEYNDALTESLQLQERIAQLQGKPKNNLTTPPAPVAGGAFGGGWGSDALSSTGASSFDFQYFLDHQEKVAAGNTKIATTASVASHEFSHAASALDDMRKRSDALGKSIEQSLGGAVSGLFDGPITSLQDGLDKILGSFAGIGQSNLSKLFDGMFSTPAAANDNNPLAGGLSVIGAAVPVDLKNPDDVSKGFAGLFKGNPQLAQNVAAGVGGLGMGFTSKRSAA